MYVVVSYGGKGLNNMRIPVLGDNPSNCMWGNLTKSPPNTHMQNSSVSLAHTEVFWALSFLFKNKLIAKRKGG